MQNIIILIVENKKLRAANKKIKKKRQKKKSYINKRKVLNTLEVQEAQRKVIIKEEARNQVVEQLGQLNRIYTPPKYNTYKSLEYIARTCLERQ